MQTNLKANSSLGRSAIRASLLERDVNVRYLADHLEWTWQRVYSQMQTLTRQQNKVLIKVKKGVYCMREVKVNVQ